LVEQELGWKARTLTPELAKIMVDADVALLEHEGRQWIDRPKFLL
jgi:GDPmannose 4,6-dehydratase